MIEQVKELGAELKSDSLGDWCPLEYGEIKVIDPGGSERWISTRFVAESPLRRRREAVCVEPIRDMSAARVLVASGDNIRANVGDTQVGTLQGGRRASPRDLERETFLEGGNSIESPS